MSYSIFLLHNFAELLIPRVGWLRDLLGSDLRVFVLIPATLLMAQVSWWFIESPMLDFRRNLIKRVPRLDPATMPAHSQALSSPG